MEPNDHSDLSDAQAPDGDRPTASDGNELTPLNVVPGPLISTPPKPSFTARVLANEQGLRAGWSVLLFFLLFIMVSTIAGFLVSAIQGAGGMARSTARGAFLGEVIAFLGLMGAAWVVALVQRHSILKFNLAGPQRTTNFFSGIVSGFLALSLLVGALWLGGWLHFGPVTLSGLSIVKYAAVWAVTFVLVGCVEEGMFRCYLQYTFTRSINFWWALGILGTVCIYLAMRVKGTATWGVYAMALLGLVPCLMLHLKRAPNSNFWQAAWVTSTLFGFVHVGNSGENWIGIFAAGAIGFVFCVSVWLTGSAWWAIGCHAGWDWAETYFYGTADSGMVAQGHYLSTSPFGNAFWSGGTDGPEGSILVLGAILILLAALMVIYRNGRAATIAMTQTEPETAD